MLTQRIVWTAPPNGHSDDSRLLRVSLLVSPRLVDTDDADTGLSTFPDWLDWPAIVRAARFEVVLNGTSVSTDLVSDPDSLMWARVFPVDTPVISRVVEDRRGTSVLAYPLAGLERDIADLYGGLAATAADGELPMLDEMRSRFGPLGRGLRALTDDELLDELRRGPDRPPIGDVVRRLAYAN